MGHLFVDGSFGLSGDMFLGALLDLGLNPDDIFSPLKQMLPEAFTYEIHRTARTGITATQVVVLPAGANGRQTSHTHSHNHSHAHHHDAKPAAQGHEHRMASDILAMIDGADLPMRVKTRSSAVFRAIAEAEARVHGVDPADVTFHEVGAVDSIVDIVGACLGLELLEVDTLSFSPLPTGYGRVQCQHGLYPVPAPATAYLLEGIPLSDFTYPSELTTPTGAGFAKALADQFGTFPGANMTKIGYGAGSKSFPEHPNVARLILFDLDDTIVPAASQSERVDMVIQLSANLDDANPEIVAYACQRFLEDGALDAWTTPITMKKGRSGVIVTVLCDPGLESRCLDIFFEETTTLGVRISPPLKRRSLAREMVMVDVGYGAVPVKIGRYRGRTVNLAPEFDRVRELATTAGKSAKEVYLDALTKGRAGGNP